MGGWVDYFQNPVIYKGYFIKVRRDILRSLLNFAIFAPIEFKNKTN